MSNIVLIGFMGSGKSTVGRMLSQKTQKYFLDTDLLIESRESIKIRDFFEKYGESAFRKKEQELAFWLGENVSNAVISTGGGMPTIVEELHRLGQVVYLEIGFDKLLERLKSDEFDKRPLFQNIEFAREIFESRRPIYKKQAEVTLDATKSPDELVSSIISRYSL
jgi:shikimate kinase